MQKKTLTTLSIVCVLVVIISAYLLTRGPHEGATETLGLDAFTMQNLDSVTRATPQETVMLERSGDTWAFNGATIDSTALAQAVDTLQNARATQVARNGRTQQGYGLSAPSYTITFVSGSKTLALDVSMRGTVPGSVYVARAGEDSVYLLEGTTLGDLARKDWKSMVPAPEIATTTQGVIQ